jgi:hypothetical protein
MEMFKALTNKLTGGGNLIFGSCSIGADTAGINFGKSMNTFTGGRLNILMAQQAVQPRYYADPNTGKMQVLITISKFIESIKESTIKRGY